MLKSASINDLNHMQRSRESLQLSVVMPVHNGERFLRESISSILNQTFSDFEFVILDDASTDESARLIREWASADPRIRIIQSDRKLGLSGSSNFVVKAARSPLVARMDADDISHRDRLRQQVEIMERCPDVVAVGTLWDGIDSKGRMIRPRDRWRLVRYSRYIPFPHGSIMFRRSAFDAVGGYDDKFVAGEDQDLCFKLSGLGRVVTLSDALYRFRYHASNSTLLTDARAVEALKGRHGRTEGELAALYMLGAMRLWSGQSPRTLQQMTANGHLHWDLQSLRALAAATIGTLSPTTMRFMLRSLIRLRDGLVSLRVQDGRPYEWRLK